MTTDIDAKLIEQGRKLFAGDWQFFWASPSIETLPPMAGMEVAFAGRSNVGKSSLINALTGRNALARTSHTPGRTQELIFFEANVALRLSNNSTFTPLRRMMKLCCSTESRLFQAQ